jgi:hypothetical protein
MQAHTRTEALLGAIERRLAEISERQHALALEKTRLTEHITPLRLGIASPDATLAELRAKGITLRGVTAAPSANRRPPGVVLRAVVPSRKKVTPLPTSHSETA